jgi:outer membrane biosynthesis protein TonB
MNRLTRIALTAAALSLPVLLAGCESFDPTSIFDAEIFNTKKKLQGERHPVFPEGTPGVAQGVPAELVKGYQAPPEPEPQQAAVEPEKPKPKPKPKPKVVAKPAEQPSAPAPQAQSQPAQQRPPAAAQWPGTGQPTTGGGVAWPDPPAQR